MLDSAFSKFCCWMEENPDGMSLHRSSVGAILIEFSIAVPVLFTLIYYIHDLPRYKQLQDRMSFAAHEIASTIQNIAKIKGGVVTRTDISNATHLANLSVFPGTTQYTSTDRWMDAPLGYIPLARIHYVVGTGSNEAKIKWMCRPYPCGMGLMRKEVYTSESYSTETKVKSWSGKPEDIYPDLKLDSNETKIIVEYKLETDKTDSKIFGFYLLDPLKSYSKSRLLFNSIVIFSPIPGAFSATLP